MPFCTKDSYLKVASECSAEQLLLTYEAVLCRHLVNGLPGFILSIKLCEETWSRLSSLLLSSRL